MGKSKYDSSLNWQERLVDRQRIMRKRSLDRAVSSWTVSSEAVLMKTHWLSLGEVAGVAAKVAKAGVMNPSLVSMFAKTMREWLVGSFKDERGYPSIFGIRSASSPSVENDGFAVFVKELGKQEFQRERLDWLRAFHSEEGKQAAWQGWGFEGYWLACALERDDAQDFSSMLDAGCDPWSLALGLHPLDCAWRLNAKHCAKALGKHVCPMEKAGQKVLQSDAMKWPLLYKANMPIMSSMYYQGKSLEGFGLKSKVPSLAKAWKQSVFDLDQFGASWYLRQLASPSRSRADVDELGQMEEMSVDEALMYWQSHADSKSGQPQWVESLRIFEDSTCARPSEKGPRL